MGHAWLSVLGRFREHVADFHRQVCYQHASYIGMIVCGELCLIYYLTTAFIFAQCMYRIWSKGMVMYMSLQ